MNIVLLMHRNSQYFRVLLNNSSVVTIPGSLKIIQRSFDGYGLKHSPPINHKHSVYQIRFLQYKNFGHRPEFTPRFTKLWHFFLGASMFALCYFDFGKMLGKYFNQVPRVDAASLDSGDKEDKEEELPIEENANDKLTTNRKKKISFRDRKIIEYENRIRQYSTPDKVFRYFATLKVYLPNGDYEIFMTPDDFLRSITPGMRQPEGLGLDQFKRFDPKTWDKQSEKLAEEIQLETNSIFLKLGSSGLISFSDYIFLLTILSTSKRHFEIAFRMFDLNGDGEVDAEEFDQVALLVRQTTSVGSRHRDHSSTGTFKGVNSALSTLFFGVNRDQKLTIEKFLDFQEQLQREILTLEFRRKELREDGKLSEVEFADLLIAYAGYPTKKRAKMLKRVRKEFKEQSLGISLKDYLDFFHFLNNINDVDTALIFYNIAGASIDPGTFKHVARTVTRVDLNDHVINVVFTVFDENLDGQLSNREFIAVMKNRLMRGLEKPKDTGFIKFLQSATKCAKETRPALLDF